MTPTTLRLLRADFRTQIEAIDPSHVERDVHRWRYVSHRRDVPGPELRTFAMQFVDAKPMTDGFYGTDAVEWQCTLRVWTAYGELADEDDDTIIGDDAADLENTLKTRVDPALTGFVSIDYDGWESQSDEPGNTWGYHAFRVRYAADGSS